MNTNRLHLAMLAVLIGSAAMVGCKKKEEPAPMPPVASEPAATAPAPMPAVAATASVTGVDLGNAVGADMRVAAPMGTFAPKDTIHAAVMTATSDPAASVAGKLGAKWTYLNADGSSMPVHEESKDLTFAGDGVTDFQISKPDGWPTGKYKVEITLDGNVVQTRDFEVK